MAASNDSDAKIAAARKQVEDLKADLVARKKSANDTDLAAASSDIPAEGKSRLILRRTLKGHLAKIYALHWCEDSLHLVSAAQDGKLIVWHGPSTNKIHAIPLRSAWVMTCAYSPSGQWVASGGLDNCCSLFNLRNLGEGHPAQELTAHNGFLSCCRFESDNQLLTGSGDQTCMKWNVETGNKLQEFVGHVGDVIGIALSPDKNTFVSGACDSTAKLWDMRNGKHVMTFRGHESDINSVAFFPSGNAFATGSDDAHVLLWDIRSGQDIQRFHSADISSGITSVDFSSSGRYLFGGYDDHKVRVWDTCRKEIVGTLANHDNRVSCLGVPKSGEAICTGSWDSNLKIYA